MAISEVPGQDKVGAVTALALQLGDLVHIDLDQGSTLHVQGVPEAELVDLGK